MKNIYAKRLMSIISLVLVIAIISGTCVFADDNRLDSQLDAIYKSVEDWMSKDVFLEIESVYRELSISAELSEEVVLSSLDEILEKYDGSEIRTYVKENFRSTLLVGSMSMIDPGQDAEIESAGGKWYYNTGTSLPHAPSYSSTNMLSLIYYGNILIENDATTGGMLGHAAIVEGKFYNYTYSMYYIRLIEAIGSGTGVCRGVVDDDRYADKAPRFYSVYNANSSVLSNAVSFAAGQFGKPWLWYNGKSYSPSASTWYCSELVWAAYKNQGIDIAPALTYADPVMPFDIRDSTAVSQIYITEY